MFWRFGLNRSAIDDLLDKEDLTLEELLFEDELLQECKAHNNKLIEQYPFIKKNKVFIRYFIIEFSLFSTIHLYINSNSLRDPAILSQLLNYMIRDDLDDRQRFKYEFIRDITRLMF